MRIGISVACAAWLVVGAMAANQRDYFGHGLGSCSTRATVVATIAAGPLNFQGLRPTITCPRPSA
jgi:hypothetical protein